MVVTNRKIYKNTDIAKIEMGYLSKIVESYFRHRERSKLLGDDRVKGLIDRGIMYGMPVPIKTSPDPLRDDLVARLMKRGLFYGMEIRPSASDDPLMDKYFSRLLRREKSRNEREELARKIRYYWEKVWK